jgi:hypothetical protein
MARGPDVAVDFRSEANGALWTQLKARLAAGEPVCIPFDPFRPYRGPTAQEPVTVLFPPPSLRRS